MTIEEKRLPNSPIYYYVSGSQNKECIVCIHAAFANHNQYKSQVNYFSKEYRVITFDLIGHGKSTDTIKTDTIEKTADYINDILMEEHIEIIHLIGISIGAVLAQDFANKYPESVASLSCFGGYNINNFDLNLQKENGVKQMLMMLKAFFSIKWFAKSNKLISAYTKVAQDQFYEMNLRFKKKSFLYLATLSNLVNKYETKPRSYPILIGCGEKDIPMELQAVKMWHEDEPDSKVIIFKHSGHLVNMDVPEVFNREYEKFLKSE